MGKKVYPTEDFSEHDIGKYLAGELNDKESAQIESWIQQDPKNKRFFSECKWLWDLTGQIPESKTIDIEKARSKVINKLPGFGRRNSFFAMLSRVAAILFLPLLIASLLYFFLSRLSVNTQDFTSEINVSYGTVNHFVLSDGTNVWLNSGTRFEYPTAFKGSARKVYLEGEAYFKVAQNRKPFIVQTAQTEVVATGTSFNILAYPDDDRNQTTLLEGKVALYKLHPDSKPVFITDLEPNETASYFSGKNDVVISFGNAEKSTSWIDGKLIFSNDSFDEIIRELSRWYNTDIKLMDPELQSYRYTATFTDETLMQVLELLRNSAPITYTYSQRAKNADDTFTKRQVEIRIIK